jgi:hemerythrin superfamily protein
MYCLLLQSLLDHMHHEEDELLPKFKACEGVTQEYLMQLGRLFEDSKLFAPSR